MDKIPSVDLRDFLSDNPERKQKFVNEIGKAYEEIGFVALKGHFLDDKLVDDLYGEVKNFFELPTETKQKYEIPGIGGQRGYVGFGKETAKGFKKGDLKEFWHFGQYVSDDSKYKSQYPDNVIVDELPKFNEVGKETYQMLEKTGKYVLRALALYLGLDEFYFDDKIAEGNSILRPIHYPPITQEPDDAVRAAAHGDINLITLLMGSQGKGLQVQNHKGEWIDAIAQPESTIHRVVNPPRELWGTSRYSIPFFMHPVSEMSLNALENCVDENNPKLYEDTTAGEFLHERLIELGLIKK